MYGSLVLELGEMEVLVRLFIYRSDRMCPFLGDGHHRIIKGSA